MTIKSSEICSLPLPTKESEIIDFFLGTSLKDRVLNIMPVQKQQNSFKAFVTNGDYNGRVDLGVKCSKAVATAF